MDALAQAFDAMRQGRLADARCHLDAVPEPRDARALHAAAALAQLEGRASDALALLARALADAPGDAGLNTAVGQVHASAGDFEAALAAWRKAAELAPAQPVPRVLLGVTLHRLGRPREAARELRTACANGADASAWLALGEAEFECGRHAAALDAYERALADAPRTEPFVLLRRAQCLRGLGRSGAAAAQLGEATVAEPGVPALWIELGGALEDLGDADAALHAYSRARAVDPTAGEPLALRIALRAEACSPSEIDDARRIAEDPSTPAHPRALLHYTFGHVEARRGDTARAAMHWDVANGLRRAAGPAFDRGAYSARIDRIIEAFDRARLTALRREASPDPRPVLVVGMPRSGTTLVERILSAHSAVAGCGERADLGHLADDLADATHQRWPSDATGLEPGWQCAAAARYLADPRCVGAARVVDKHPYNTFHLGLATALFANVRIAWCLRDPRDVALSIYSRSFAPHSPFATALDDIRHVIAEQERLRRHWRDALPSPMLEVRYEALVADPAAAARRLVEFVGLPWDDACLRSHEAQGEVRTMSRWQVREPVHARSIGGWRAYPQWFDTDEWRALAACCA